MININYTRLFNLVVGHQYFKDGHDRFITLKPTIETESLLKNGKMLFKRLPHGVTVLYRASDDEVTPFVELEDNQHFVFTLSLSDVTSFLNITDLDESPSRRYQSHNVVLFTNDPANPSDNNNAPEVLNLEIIDSLRSQLFTYAFVLSGSPATAFLTVRDRSGNPVSIGYDTEGDPLPIPIEVALQSNGEYNQQIDLRDKSKGKYTITVANSDGSTVFKEEEIYADGHLEKKNIFGIVDLEYNDTTNHLYGDTEEYQILLNRLNTIWKYFIVNKNENIDFSSESLLITDTGSTNGTPYIINTFSRSYASILLTADATGTGGNSISLGYSGTGNPPAVVLSGKTLSGGATGVAATGVITIINNDLTGYTVSVDGTDFTEGTAFSNGATAADTAANLIAAINGSSVSAGAADMPFDTLINNQQTLVFSSDDNIPFFELPKLNIELRQQSDSQTIIPHLSNPSPSGNKKAYDSKVETEIFVFI
jgi:hypothetical protein